MKQIKNLFALILFSACFILLQCSTPKVDVYSQLMQYADSVKVVNTHEHQRNPEELDYTVWNFWTLLTKTYLMADVVSAGGSYVNADMINNKSLDDLWDLNGEYLNYTSQTSYYKQFLEGLRICYNYNELKLSKAGINEVSEQIGGEYKDYKNWFDSCFKNANFETMFLDQYWAPHNMDIDTSCFTLVFHINKLVNDIASASDIYTPEDEHFKTFSNESGKTQIYSLDDYLEFVDFMLQLAIKNGAVGLKNSMAYGRTLDYENVSKEIAEQLFNRSQLNSEEKKALQDYVFHYILDRAAEYNLPVQIHTGYLAGTGNQLANGKPTKLNMLLLQHRNTKFDLFHGGFPWTGEFVALGKMFPNVYLNLVWLPQISKERAIVTFDEMLDCVPYNKIMWGGDCHLIEESVGSLEFGKQVICEVLAKRIHKEQMDLESAKTIISAVLRDNAVQLFNLKYN